MKVFVVCNAQRYHLPNVYLKDGFYPEYVGSKGDGLPSMEPAIWCKLLIVDSILIDCDDKCIKWSTTGDESDSNQQHTHWSSKECSDHDDEEELYEMAKLMIDKAFEDCKLLFFRMLHCYVLPKIFFDINDFERVELARKEQVQNVQTLTDKLEAKCFDVFDCQEKLDSIKEEFLPCIDNMITNGQCSKLFLDLLVCDLVDYEKRVREKIATAQLRYAELVPTEPSSLKRPSLELLEARQERDFMDKKLVLILKAREEILDRQENLLPVAEVQVNDILQQYMDKRSELQMLKEEKNMLTQQKYCALMVREVLNSIVKDLKDQNFAPGISADSRGVRPTDVLQNSLQPEWQTLSERVATVVYNPKHPIGILFENFCSEIIEICKEASHLQNGKTEILQISRSRFYVSLQPTEILSDSEYVSVAIVDPYKDKLFQVKEKVSLHMEKATKLLTEHFNKTESSFQNKIRLAYEHCFYEKTLKKICWLYDKVYHEHINDIKKDIQRITECPAANMLSLPVNKIFQDLFAQQELNSNFPDESCLSCSGLYVDGQYNISDDKLGTKFNVYLCSSEDDSSQSNFQMDNSYNSFIDDTANKESLNNLCVMKARHHLINIMKDCCKATVLKSNDLGSLGSLIDEWDTKAKPITESLERSLSIEREDENQNKVFLYVREDGNEKFGEHFQQALNHIKAVFKAFTPLKKLKHLDQSLQIILSKVSNCKSCTSYEQCLPLLGLLLLQLQPSEITLLWLELVMLEDLIAPFLFEGPYNQALTHYQKILRVIEDLWLELSNGNIQYTVNGIAVPKPV